MAPKKTAGERGAIAAAGAAPSPPLTPPALASASSSAPASSPLLRRAQCSRQLKQHNQLPFMLRAIYQYLAQFGFEELVKHMKTEVDTRFPLHSFDCRDESESDLRLSMYRCFTLTTIHTPVFQDSAEVVLDDLALLCNLSRSSRDVTSTAFSLERELRIQACMTVSDDKAQFEEVVKQYFDETVAATKQQAEASDARSTTGQTIEDAALKRQQLYYDRLALVEYQQNKSSLQKLQPKNPVFLHNSAAVSKFESEHSRDDLQTSMRLFLKGLLERLQVQGAVFLEQVSSALLDKRLIINREDEEEDADMEDEEAANEPMDEGEPENDEEPVEPLLQEHDEESEEEAVTETVKPTRAASKPASKSSPIKAQLAPSAARSVRAVPEVIRNLHAAQTKLNQQGRDPLADTLRDTQTLSRKRKTDERQESKEDNNNEEDQQQDEEEEDFVHVDLKEEDVEPVEEKPSKKKGGRPRKNAAAQPSLKYDRESRTATKIEFSDTEELKAESKDDRVEEDVDDDDQVSLPAFKPKSGKLTLKGSPTSKGKSPSQLAPLDAGQRGRPAVHRHLHDRAARRVPWSSEEIQKLTEGVIEYASERKKWSLILTKYSEFFQDRTVVDLKDKWRNLKGKVSSGLVGRPKKKAKVDSNEIAEDIEDIDE